MMRRLLFAIIAVLLSVGTAFADATVGPTGDYQTLAAAEAGETTGTITVAAGTYTEDWTFTKALDWVADGTVIVIADSGTRSLYMTGTGAGSITGFTFGSESSKKAYSFYSASSTANKTLTNCTFTGSTSYLGYIGSSNSDIVFNNCTFTTSEGGGIQASGDGVTFSGGTLTAVGTQGFQTVSGNDYGITVSGMTINLNVSDYGFYLRSNGTTTIENNTINLIGSDANTNNLIVTTNATAGALVFDGNTVDLDVTTSSYVFDFRSAVVDITFTGNSITTDTGQTNTVIVVGNQADPTVTGNTIDTRASGTSACWPIYIYSTGTDCGTVTVSNNIIYQYSLSGYGIRIGAESTDAGDNYLDGAVITGNTLYGPNYFDVSTAGVSIHGILYGFNKDAQIRRNRIYGYGYGVVVKDNGTAWTAGDLSWNLIVDTYQYDPIHIKGSASVPIYNNTVYIQSGYGSKALVGVIVNPDGGTGSTGTVLRNNVLVGPTHLIEIDASSSSGTDSDYNCLYPRSGTNVGKIDSTTYTLATWRSSASQGTNSVSSNPLLKPIYELLSASPCIDAGTDAVYSAAVTDLAGNAVTDASGNSLDGGIDMGAYEYQGGAAALMLGF